MGIVSFRKKLRQAIFDIVDEATDKLFENVKNNLEKGYQTLPEAKEVGLSAGKWVPRVDKKKHTRSGMVLDLNELKNEIDIIKIEPTIVDNQASGGVKATSTTKPYLPMKLEYGTEGLDKDSRVPEKWKNLPARPFMRPAVALLRTQIKDIVVRHIANNLIKVRGVISVSSCEPA